MNRMSGTLARTGAVAIVVVMTGCTAFALPPNPTGTPTAAVLAFHEAWDTNDCALYTSVTTARYRSEQGPADCEDFAAAFLEQADLGWQVEITDESSADDGARVTSTESWTETDGVAQTQDFLYELVLVDSNWKIDSLS